MTVAIVAEISANHGGDFQTALKLIDLAREAGADFVKFQYFTPDKMAISGKAPDGLWAGQDLASLYGKAATPADWLPRLFQYAELTGIKAFSSVFDEDGLDFIAKFKPPFIKISSFENNHYPLIAAACTTNIPLIISTGMMQDLAELEDLAEFCHGLGARGLTFLKCTSAYPAPLHDLGLGSIPLMAAIKTKPRVGFSDHTTSPAAASLAIAKGATMIERHIALSADALDGEFSSVGDDFKAYVACLRLVEQACKPEFGVTGSELRSLRRSLYATCDIAKHERFGPHNVAVLRGNQGVLHPRMWWTLIDQKHRARRDITRGEPIRDGDF